MTAGIKIDGLSVLRGEKAIVDGVTFAVPAGTIGAILGPSGAGKSTILRALAGLVTPDAGTLELGGERVHDGTRSLPPERRSAGMLFQGFALWGHMTARAHLRFALEGRNVPRTEWETRIREVADVLRIEPLLGRRPASLSGGERQRVALARALVTRPLALLLDEPTASVDPAGARDVHAYVRSLHERFGITTLLVTHDQDEAMSLAGSMLVLDRGTALQAGSPAELYARPASARVASFLGEGVFIPAVLRAPGSAAETALGVISVTPGSAAGSGRALIRPESVVVSSDGGGIPGVVVAESFRGPTSRLAIRMGDLEVMADVREPKAPGTRVSVRHSGIAPFFPEAGA